MGTVRLGPIVTVIGMMLLGLVFVVTILTGPGNVLGATYRFLWIPALLMGCMTPRLAMYVLVVMAIYLDVPKKFLVVGDVMDFRDVYFILALPPVMLAGIVLQYVASFSLRIRVFSRRAAVLFSAAVALVAATALFSIMKYGANPVVLKALANTSAYYGMIFVVPLVLPRLVDIQKYQRFIVVMMVPAAVHAILHFFYGLADFETDYMRSGFSQNYSYVLWGEGIFGPFSAQGPLSASMAMCAALCLTPFLFRSRMSKGLRLMHPAVSIVLFVLFATTAVLSLKRGPLLLIPGAFVGFFILRSRILTLGAYGGAGALVFILIFLGEELAGKLEAWQTAIYELFGAGGTKFHVFQIRTFYSRLNDFSLLADLSNWAPFGAEIAQGDGGYRAHSYVSRFVLEYGYVPVLIGFLIFVPVIFYLHRHLIRMSKGQSFEVFQLRIAAALSFSYLGAAMMGVLSMDAYPNPFFFAFFLGVLASGLTRSLQSDYELPAGEEAEEALVPEQDGYRVLS